MLVSIIMMAPSGGIIWSQLLTFMPVRWPRRIELPQTGLRKPRHCEQSDTESNQYPGHT